MYNEWGGEGGSRNCRLRFHRWSRTCGKGVGVEDEVQAKRKEENDGGEGVGAGKSVFCLEGRQAVIDDLFSYAFCVVKCQDAA